MTWAEAYAEGRWIVADMERMRDEVLGFLDGAVARKDAEGAGRCLDDAAIMTRNVERVRELVTLCALRAWARAMAHSGADFRTRGGADERGFSHP